MESLRRAAAHPLQPWISALALAVGALAARLIVALVPAGGGDVAAARAYGIISVSVLAGHSKSAESLAYALALAGGITVALGVWLAWAMPVGGRAAHPATSSTMHGSPVSILECVVAALFFLLCFARLWNGTGAWHAPWILLAEEGEALAWADTVLRGGVLSRDVFCLYGPLATWSVAALFALFGPSLGLWRRWIFGLNAVSLLAIYLLARRFLHTRVAAVLVTAFIGLACAPAMPAMSWSLARVSFGLAALACLAQAFERDGRGRFLASGALLAGTLLYSQEVGVACSVAAGAALLLGRHPRRRALALTAAGGVLVLAPVVAYLAVQGALAATIENLFLFPRIRLLGFAAYPFPVLDASPESLRSYFVPVVLGVSGFVTAQKLAQGRRDTRVLLEVALFLFGSLLFTSGLSRPDAPHLLFATPPAFLLLAGMVEDCALALRSRPRRVPAALALAAALGALHLWYGTVAENGKALLTPTPPEFRTLAIAGGGSARLPGQVAGELEDVVRAIQARVPPDRPFYVFPNEALLYFLANRPQPTHFPLTVFAVTREQRLQVVAQLEESKPLYAVIYKNATRLDGIDYRVALPEVLEYLRRHYAPEDTVGSFVFLRRTG